MFEKEVQYETYRMKVKYLHVDLKSNDDRCASASALEEMHLEERKIIGKKGWMFKSSIFLPFSAENSHSVELVTYERDSTHKLFGQGALTRQESDYIQDLFSGFKKDFIEKWADI
jgi:hypothetical protein